VTQEVLALLPDFLFALKDKAILLQKLGRHDEAIAALRDFQRRMPDITLDRLAVMHKRSVLAPDTAEEFQQTLAEVWSAT
jgi:tetratricopeptide (TPR) repeat protein